MTWYLLQGKACCTKFILYLVRACVRLAYLKTTALDVARSCDPPQGACSECYVDSHFQNTFPSSFLLSILVDLTTALFCKR